MKSVLNQLTQMFLWIVDLLRRIPTAVAMVETENGFGWVCTLSNYDPKRDQEVCSAGDAA